MAGTGFAKSFGQFPVEIWVTTVAEPSCRRFEHCCPLCLSRCPHIYLRGKKACRPFAFSFTCRLQTGFTCSPLFSNAPNRMAGCPQLCGLLTTFLSAEIRPVLGTNRVTSSLCQLRFHFLLNWLFWLSYFCSTLLSLLVWADILFVCFPNKETWS